MRTTRFSSPAVALISGAVLVGAALSAVKVEKGLPGDVLTALREGTEFAVLEVDPKGYDAVPAYSWRILKHNFVKDEAVRKEVVEAVQKSFAQGDLSAECFIPRHAVSTTYNKKKYVLVICFQCMEALVYVSGEEKYSLPISGAAKAVLDKVLAGPGTAIYEGAE